MCVYVLLSQLFFFFLPSSAAALEFLKNNPEDPINQKEFEEACGVGVVITPEQVEEAVSARTYLGHKFNHFSCQSVFSNEDMLSRWRKLSRSTRNSC